MASNKIYVNLRPILDGKGVDIDDIKRAIGHVGPCYYCESPDMIQCLYGLEADLHGMNCVYCPHCGRRLCAIKQKT